MAKGMEFKNNKILVTGGAGFIGSHLVDELLRLNNEVWIVDNLKQRCGHNSEYPDNENLKCYDVTSDEFRKYISENHFDYIFHLAACSYTPVSIKDPFYDCSVNIKGTLNLLEGLKNKMKTKVIIMSSGAVYGEPLKLPIIEAAPVKPISPYGVSKLSAEHYCFAYNKLYGHNIVIARNFSTYGPRQRKQVVYDALQKLKKADEGIWFFGTGEETRDLIYVKDAVGALIILAQKGNSACGIYNVATSKSYTVKYIINVIAAAYGKGNKINFKKEIKKGDPKHWSVCIDKIKGIGFSPEYDLMEGIAETVAWFKKIKADA